jgi:hypothetical protein
MDRHLFPTNDPDFDKFFVALILYLFGTKVPNPVTPAAGPNATRLGISAGNLDAIWQLFNLWFDIYPRATNDLTSTHPLVTTKDDLKAQIKTKLREIYGDIPQSKLTVDDRTVTRLKLRDTVPTDTPKADVAPDINIVGVKHLHHDLEILETGKQTRGVTNGQIIVLDMAIGDADLAEDQIPFSKSHFVSKADHEIDFEAADKGKTVYYRAYYENAKHEKGPKSVIVSAVIM